MTRASNFWSEITSDRPPYIIAEGADAHYGSLARAKEMIERAVEAGVDAIKFQHHIPDAEMLPDVPTSRNMDVPLFEFLSRNALSIDQHKELSELAHDLGITYLCTPFSSKAAIELNDHLKLAAFKIGSGELTDLPTLGVIADMGLPMIVSTGMAEVAEIDTTYHFLMSRAVPLILMNCTSAYPPSYRDIKLGFISVMKGRYAGAVVGHSDHTPSILTSLGAVVLGARVIEKHVTVDTSLTGPDADVSITFEQLAELVQSAKVLYEASGSSKTVLDSEREIQAWARRSIVYLQDLPAGHVLTAKDIWGKRPGTGVPAQHMFEFVGRRLLKPVSYNQLLTASDFG